MSTSVCVPAAARSATSSSRGLVPWPSVWISILLEEGRETVVARATVTWQTLRELAEFRALGGSAISLFLELDPSTAPTVADVETRLNSLLHEAERQVEAGRFAHEE